MPSDTPAEVDALAPEDESWVLTVPKEMLLSRAIALMMAGVSMNAAAAEVETNPRTLRRWLDTPAGARLKALAQRELLERGATLAVAGQNAAITKMIEALREAPEWKDKIAAARVLSMFSPQRVEISGPDAGPIEMTINPAQQLADRLSLMRTRTDAYIEAQAIEDAEIIAGDEVV
jgi:hypothetical protein